MHTVAPAAFGDATRMERLTGAASEQHQGRSNQNAQTGSLHNASNKRYESLRGCSFVLRSIFPSKPPKFVPVRARGPRGAVVRGLRRPRWLTPRRQSAE